MQGCQFLTCSLQNEKKLLIYNSQENILINLRMNIDNLPYSSRSTISSPIITRRSPPTFGSNDYKFYDSSSINKSVGYPNTQDWSNSDYQNLRRVPDEINSLRQTFDVRAHSNYQNIFSKYSQENQESIRSPQKPDMSLRQTFSTKPRFLDNYLSSTSSVPDSKYPYSSTQNERDFKMLKSPSKTQKKQVQVKSYKAQVEQIILKNKMDKQFDKLKQDRKRRLQGSKQGSKDQAFKKKNLENIYSPKYQKKQKVQTLEFQQSKTMPLINNNVGAYKSNGIIKPTNPLKNRQKQEELQKKDIPQSNINFQLYKIGKQKSGIDNFINIKSPTSSKIVSKFSTTPVSPSISSSVSINDFYIGKNLGEGKFGVVMQAFHKQTGAVFAIKKVPKQRIKKFSMENQFILQLKLQTFLRHQNILRLYHFFDDQSSIYLVLEYMQQGTLFNHLKKNKTKTLPEKEVAIKIKQIASAINYLHENQIAHRDIKPENIVLTNNVCKLCDFGWATICKDRRTTCCGTFDYTPPEIFQGSDYDDTVDLWCLGVLTYQLLVGKAPFYHSRRQQTKRRILDVQNTVINYPQHLSKAAVSFIQNLIKKNPDQRLSNQKLLSHPFLQVKQDDQ